MFSPVCRSENRFSLAVASLAVFFYCASLASPSFAQQAAPPSPAAHATEADKSVVEKAKTLGTGPVEPPPVLQQLNSAIETLTARISPAVVQILVTGYGSVEDSDRRQTAVITREHAIGSGVIVDSNGYIMTNAHVVEGAQRIRVALPMSSGDSAAAAPNIPAGRRQLFDAKVLGVYKESD